MKKTKEPQYQALIELAAKQPVETLGLMMNHVWHDDPKRLGFVLARYKFVAKMFSGFEKILEVGCGDAFGSRVVQQEVKWLTVCDFDSVFIEDIRKRAIHHWPMSAIIHDMLHRPLLCGFNGVYALDVIEHIPESDEEKFVGNMAKSLSLTGSCIIGSPSLQSQPYASAQSKAGHVNCKDAAGLKRLMEKFFHNVFIFSMNDEVLHTGDHAMSHYLFALCCHRK